MCKEKDVCEADHDWKDEIPIPDDLGKEELYDIGFSNMAVGLGAYFAFSPGALYLVDAATPRYFEEDGILYETFPYPEGGYIFF